METLQSGCLVPPFGRVEVDRRPDGSARVRAFVDVERPIERAKTGLALDGSASMRPSYGFADGLIGALFSNRRVGANLVSVEARRLCIQLAQKLDVDRRTSVVYWGTGASSKGLEVIGELTEHEAQNFDFSGPQRFGGGKTALLPAVRHFVDHFPAASFGLFLFITDGVFGDVAAVSRLSSQLAQEIAAGRRSPLKLLVVGVGDQIDHAQLNLLTNSGSGAALWRTAIAKEMTGLAEVSLALIDESLILTDSGAVRDGRGVLVRDYRDTGLPALLDFELPAGAAQEFVLEAGGIAIRQTL